MLPVLAGVVLVGAAWSAQPSTNGDAEQATTDPLDLPEVIVQLEGGQRVVGLLVEQSDEHVVLRVAGVPRSLPANKVTRLTILPPVLDRYRQIRDEIAPDDFSSIVQLSLWLEQRERYGLALEELDRALSLEPLDRRAAELRDRIAAKKMLADRKRERLARGDPAPDREVAEVEETAIPPRLTKDEINLIRVYEIDLADPPKLTIERETIADLIQRYDGDARFPITPEDQKALYDKEAIDILALIFELRAREFYDDVQVAGDPASMAAFKERVHRPLIINSCATSECHAKPGAGRLRLIREERFSDETIYTNFLMLDRFELDDGTPLINYEEPGKSPLLHLGLDRERSAFPHPVVPAPSGRGDLWRPAMRSTSDRRFENTIRWIRSMYRPRPEYPIELAPLPPAGGEKADIGPPR